MGLLNRFNWRQLAFITQEQNVFLKVGTSEHFIYIIIIELIIVEWEPVVLVAQLKFLTLIGDTSLLLSIIVFPLNA